jgi:hypothetical protein
MQCNCLKYNYLIFRTPLKSIVRSPLFNGTNLWHYMTPKHPPALWRMQESLNEKVELKI